MRATSFRRWADSYFLGPSIIRFSPLDIRVIVRILIFVVVWKFLSLDYSAFPDLLGGPEFFVLFRWLDPAAHLWQPLLFDQVWKVQALQVTSAVVLGFAFWRVSRPALVLGLLPVLLVEWNAYLYRSQMFDLDVPCALLLLAAAGPWKRMVTGDEKVTAPATWAGFALVAYMGGAYFLTGWSKLAFDAAWWESIRLDLLYPTMEIWHGQSFPAWLDQIAFGMHELLLGFPLLGVGLAVSSMIIELTWWLALFSRTARAWIPLLMVMSHLGIFLGSGLLFLSMAIVAFSLVAPWRNLFSPLQLRYAADDKKAARYVRFVHRFDWLGQLELDPRSDLPSPFVATDKNGSYSGTDALLRAAMRCPALAVPAGVACLPGIALLVRGLLRSKPRIGEASEASSNAVTFSRMVGGPVYMLALAFLALWIPLASNNTFPFAAFNTFGWSYAGAAQPNTVYRLAYLDSTTERFEPLPNNYGGFFDFRLVSLAGPHIKALLESPRTRQPAVSENVEQFARAIRTNNSNRWLLGPLAFPAHFVSESEDIAPEGLEHVYMMEGRYTFEDRELRSSWEVLGQVGSPLPATTTGTSASATPAPTKSGRCGRRDEGDSPRPADDAGAEGLAAPGDSVSPNRKRDDIQQDCARRRDVKAPRDDARGAGGAAGGEKPKREGK